MSQSARFIVFTAENSQTSNGTSKSISWNDRPKHLSGFEKRGRPVKNRKEPQARKAKDDELSLKFISHTPSQGGPAPSDRKTVRAQAMRNYWRRQRLSAAAPKKGNIQSAVSESQHKFQSREHQHMPREITSLEPFASFPIRIEPYMLEQFRLYETAIFRMTYSIEYLLDVNPVKLCWIPMAMRDAALLHTIIFCADGIGARVFGIRESPTAVMNLREALKIINGRLRKAVVSDATIVAVTALAYAEISKKVNGNTENWHIHMRGLKQMVDLRGGIEAFAFNPYVHNKLNRADLCGSIDHDERPYFENLARYSFPIPTAEAPPTNELPQGFRRISSCLEQNHIQLIGILQKINVVTQKLRTIYFYWTRRKEAEPPPKPDIDPITLRHEITFLQYELLQLPRPNERAHSVPNLQIWSLELLRLGLLIYTTTLCNEVPYNAILLPQLSTKFKKTYETVEKAQKATLYEEVLPSDLKLWLVFIARSQFASLEVRSWLDCQIRENYSAIGIDSMDYDHMGEVLKGLFWVDEIHEVALKKFYSSAGSVLEHTFQ